MTPGRHRAPPAAVATGSMRTVSRRGWVRTVSGRCPMNTGVAGNDGKVMVDGCSVARSVPITCRPKLSYNGEITAVHRSFAAEMMWPTTQLAPAQGHCTCVRSHFCQKTPTGSDPEHNFGRSSECQVRHSLPIRGVKTLPILYRFVIAAGMGNPQASRIRS